MERRGELLECDGVSHDKRVVTHSVDEPRDRVRQCDELDPRREQLVGIVRGRRLGEAGERDETFVESTPNGERDVGHRGRGRILLDGKKQHAVDGFDVARGDEPVRLRRADHLGTVPEVVFPSRMETRLVRVAQRYRIGMRRRRGSLRVHDPHGRFEHDAQCVRP